MAMGAPVAKPIKGRHSVAVAGNRLAVDQERARPQLSSRLRVQRKPVRPVVAVTRHQAHPGGVAPHHHAEAVELDLVDPAGPDGGRSAGEGRQGSINADTRMPGFLGRRATPSSRMVASKAWRLTY